MTDFPFYVVVRFDQNVYDAIRAGEWYISEIAAEATADQLAFMEEKPYFVIGGPLKQQDNTPTDKPKVLKSRIQRTIKDMVTGDSFYTVPWAAAVNKEDIPYLDTTFMIHDKPGGTVQMLVQKLGPDWYQLGIPEIYKFRKVNPRMEDPDICWNLNFI
jgi:hypothetical protein